MLNYSADHFCTSDLEDDEIRFVLPEGFELSPLKVNNDDINNFDDNDERNNRLGSIDFGADEEAMDTASPNREDKLLSPQLTKFFPNP